MWAALSPLLSSGMPPAAPTPVEPSTKPESSPSSRDLAASTLSRPTAPPLGQERPGGEPGLWPCPCGRLTEGQLGVGVQPRGWGVPGLPAPAPGWPPSSLHVSSGCPRQLLPAIGGGHGAVCAPFPLPRSWPRAVCVLRGKSNRRGWRDASEPPARPCVLGPFMRVRGGGRDSLARQGHPPRQPPVTQAGAATGASPQELVPATQGSLSRPSGGWSLSPAPSLRTSSLGNFQPLLCSLGPGPEGLLGSCALFSVPWLEL